MNDAATDARLDSLRDEIRECFRLAVAGEIEQIDRLMELIDERAMLMAKYKAK